MWYPPSAEPCTLCNLFGVDDALIIAGAAAASSAAGGVMSYMGQQDANDSMRAMNTGQMKYNWDVTQWTMANQIEQAEKTRAFNQWAQENAQNFNTNAANIQRGWAEYMTSSAYQRAMNDMRAAGLNPILAYQQGGAAVPNASAAQSPSAAASNPGLTSGLAAPGAPTMQNEMAGLGSALGNATQVANVYNQARQVAANVDKTTADIKLAEANTAQAEAATRVANASEVTELNRAGLISDQAARERVQAGELAQRTRTGAAEEDLTRQRGATEREETERRRQQRLQAENETARQNRFGVNPTTVTNNLDAARAMGQSAHSAASRDAGRAAYFRNDPYIGPIFRLFER